MEFCCCTIYFGKTKKEIEGNKFLESEEIELGSGLEDSKTIEQQKVIEELQQKLRAQDEQAKEARNLIEDLQQKLSIEEEEEKTERKSIADLQQEVDNQTYIIMNLNAEKGK